MTSETQLLSLLRSELANIITGSFFLFIALIAFSIAAVRRRRSVRLLVWVGAWSGLFGANELRKSRAVVEALPHSFAAAQPLLVISLYYLIIVAATFALLELTLGVLRRFLAVLLIANVAVAVATIARFLVSGREYFRVYSELLLIAMLVALVLSLSVPQLSRRFLVLARHRVLTIGALIFAAVALWVDVARRFDSNVPDIYNTLAFAIFLLSIGYTALEMVITEERRLLSIDKELAIARQLQFSILPEHVPEVANLKIAAAYKPMTAVAGDFYEFLPVDRHRTGFLVADVSGHGVPAALIASMIKVAVQSLSEYAADPAELLRRLGRMIAGQLRGQFVSACYLWVDSECRTARYSAAGHPPLLWWRNADSSLTRIESNGLLFGVVPDCDYPVCELALSLGDRLLVCTDGVTEPENTDGEPFGDHRLEQIVRHNQSRPAPELSTVLLDDLRSWQTASLSQHDDITLIVIDVQ